MPIRPVRPFGSAFAFCLLAMAAACVQAATDPLPSWNEGAVKARIVSFVQAMAARDPALAAHPAIAAAARGDLRAPDEVVAITLASTTSADFAERVRAAGR